MATSKLIAPPYSHIKAISVLKASRADMPCWAEQWISLTTTIFTTQYMIVKLSLRYIHACNYMGQHVCHQLPEA